MASTDESQAPFQTTAIPTQTKTPVLSGGTDFQGIHKRSRDKIPGTKTIFPGLENEQQTNDLWAYIKQFDQSGSIKK
jgi:hypothetical protein